MVNKHLEQAYYALLHEEDMITKNHFTKQAGNFLFFYLFSNEDLTYFFDAIDVNQKSVLTVGSSGDQAIYSLINGAKRVVHFDINPFSRYYFDFKVAMIKNLSYKEFIAAYNQIKNPGILTSQLYARISHDIHGDSRYFWDTLFLNGFGAQYPYLHFIGSNHCLYTKNEYNIMQNFFNNNDYTIEFLNCELKEIDKHLNKNDKFDLIMLSNIYDYAIRWENNIQEFNKNKDIFKKSITDLGKYLNKNGQIQFDYVWEDIHSKRYAISHILNLNNTYAIESPHMDSGSLMYAPDGIPEMDQEMK